MSSKVTKLSGRKPIGTAASYSYDTNETKPIPKPQPLLESRSHQNLNCCLTAKDDQTRHEEELKDIQGGESKDLFIFGKPQGDNSVFRFSKFLGGVGSTVKRLFGFKS